MPQNAPMYINRNRIDTKALAIITIVIFLIIALSVVRLWASYLPQMEEAGRETDRMMGGSEDGAGGAVSIIQYETIPEIRLFLLLSLIIFGISDGIFIMMLWMGKPQYEHMGLILPLFIIYSVNRIASGAIIIITTPMIVVGSNPYSLMNLLNNISPVFTAVSICIILLFQLKIFSEKKRKATKILLKQHDDTVY